MSSEAESAPKRSSRRRRWSLRALGVLLGVLLILSLVVLIEGWRAFGQGATGARRAAIEASPQWADDVFVNPQPIENDNWAMITGLFDKSDDSAPASPVPAVHLAKSAFEEPPPSGLRITWLGHSTLLIEIDGFRILTDPVWGARVSPVSWIGPQRWYAPPIALADLPPIDAVVLSHDHYDHLDHPTIEAMRDWDTHFVAPLGVDAHLAYWGVPEERIVALDWWDSKTLGDLEITCTPARHASGRAVWDQNATLWASYAFRGPRHRVYFSGDTGLFPALAEIGERLGPFDVTLVEAGAYGRGWPDWHLGPEQAVRAHQMLRGKLLVPIHWGLFDLAYHAWTEPAERTMAAAEAAGVSIAIPRPGQSIEPSAPPPLERWWPTLPWRSGADDPIVASKM